VVQQSIDLLKRLRASGKSIRLKFYSDAPLVKLSSWEIIFGYSITIQT